MLDQPVLGYGPGRFNEATAPRRTLELVRAEGAGRYFVEAHNIIVEYGTTTGVVGLLLFLLWLVAGLRGAGPTSSLGLFAIGVLVVHLLQPISVSTTPLVFLALGAGSSPQPGVGRAARWVSAAAVLPALAVAGSVAFGLWTLNIARLDFDLGRAQQADRYSPPWWRTTEQLARIHVLRGLERDDAQEFEKALEYRRQSVAENPKDPEPLQILGNYQLQLQRRSAATHTFESLLRLDPWSTVALNGLGHLVAEDDRFEEALVYFRRSYRADPSQSNLPRIIDEIEDRTRNA